MTTVNCPQGDGLCQIPDPALVVSNGTISLVRAPLLEQIFPEGLHLDNSNARELPDTEAEQFFVAVRSPSYIHAGDIDISERITREFFSVRRGIIVTCSCSHTWIYDQ
jgi:hypothetical protein